VRDLLTPASERAAYVVVAIDGKLNVSDVTMLAIRVVFLRNPSLIVRILHFVDTVFESFNYRDMVGSHDILLSVQNIDHFLVVLDLSLVLVQ
jgi:hypothetical protein